MTSLWGSRSHGITAFLESFLPPKARAAGRMPSPVSSSPGKPGASAGCCRRKQPWHKGGVKAPGASAAPGLLLALLRLCIPPPPPPLSSSPSPTTLSSCATLSPQEEPSVRTPTNGVGKPPPRERKMAASRVREFVHAQQVKETLTVPERPSVLRGQAEGEWQHACRAHPPPQLAGALVPTGHGLQR